MPDVSVLIPAYKAAHCIAEALDSVFAQKFSGTFEVIVVNDGSPDTPDFERAIAPYRDRITYHVQPNGGVSAARNKAFELSRAPLIQLLDADDVLMPDCLQLQTDFMRNQPSFGVVYGNMRIFGGSVHEGKTLDDLNAQSESPSFGSLVRAKATVYNSSSMVRREAITNAGGWDPNLVVCQDLGLWLEIAAQGWEIYHLPQVVAGYRRLSGDSLSSNEARLHEDRLAAYRKVFKNQMLPPAKALLLSQRIDAATGEAALVWGKQAFQDGNPILASQYFAKAAKHNKSQKLWLIATLLRVCPKLVQGLVSLRGFVKPRYRNA